MVEFRRTATADERPPLFYAGYFYDTLMMNRPPYAAYLFDLDGTLLNTIDLIVECFRHTLEYALGESPPAAAVKANIGLPLRPQMEFFLRGRGEFDYDFLMGLHMTYQKSIWREYIQPYDGAVGLLDLLRGQGAKLAVVTSRRRETAELYSRELGVIDRVDLLVTPEDTARPKPAPDPARYALDRLETADAGQALFIGDAPFDIQCGSSAGCDTCFVNWGHEDAHRLDPLPSHTVDRLCEVADLTPKAAESYV